MPYLIDGHNLIPKIPGLNLQQPDDEEKLVQRLKDFASRSGESIEVYFDRAAIGHAGPKKYGSVKVVFVQRSSSADGAIVRRLNELGDKARNWTVVSSDGAVRSAARMASAPVLGSDEFARRLAAPSGDPASKTRPKRGDRSGKEAMPPKEIDYWKKQFGVDDEDK